MAHGNSNSMAYSHSNAHNLGYDNHTSGYPGNIGYGNYTSGYTATTPQFYGRSEYVPAQTYINPRSGVNVSTHIMNPSEIRYDRPVSQAYRSVDPLNTLSSYIGRRSYLPHENQYIEPTRL